MAAAALTEDLVEEVLLHLPPDDAASLARAALVSKRWCRLVCGRRFRSRFREFHGTPPLLGLVCQRDRTTPERFFVPSSSFSPRDHADRRNLKAMHSCHGRVLLHSTTTRRTSTDDDLEDLFVWDPITDELRKLPRWPLYSFHSYCDGNAAVLCAVVGDGCDHLDCHHGPFMVVFAGTDKDVLTFTCVYSSEAERWSDPIFADQRYWGFEKGGCVLVGTAVYFKCRAISEKGYGQAMLKYDLLTQEASPIHIPRVGDLKYIHLRHTVAVLMATKDDRLGFAFTDLFTSTKPKLYLWSREHGTDGDAGWAQSRVVDLDMLLQTELSTSTRVILELVDSFSYGHVIGFSLSIYSQGAARC